MYEQTLMQPVPMELNPSALQQFQSEAVRSINALETTVSTLRSEVMSLQGQIAIAGRVLTWMQEHRPEALQDYETTKQVAKRLSESNNGEVMTEKMI